MCVPSSERVAFVVGQEVVREEVVPQDEVAPGLLPRRASAASGFGLLAAVAGAQWSAKAIFPLRRTSRVRREIILAVFLPLPSVLNGVLEREAILGAQVERHVRHAGLGLHPGALGILADLAENVEFLLA